MKIAFDYVKIENFKKQQEPLTVAFGNRTYGYGENGSGKTTILDAISWVLFGKNYSGDSKFEIRPKDKNGDLIHKTVISVELGIIVDGKKAVIRKEQEEKWQKERGTTIERLTGNTNRITINELSYSEKAFKEWMDGIISEEVFKFASNPGAFLSLDTKTLREKLTQLVSSFTEEDVLNSDEELLPLKGMLDGMLVKEMSAKVKREKKEYQDQLVKVEPSILTLKRQIVEGDRNTLESEKTALETQITAIDDELGNTETAYKNVMDKKDRILALRMDLSGIETAGNRKIQTNLRNINEQINKLNSEKQRNESQVETMKRIIDRNNIDIANRKKEIQSLAAERKQILESKQDPNSLICSFCGQALPKDKIEAVNANFEKKKKHQVDDINKRGKQAQDLNKQAQELVKEYTAECEKLSESIKGASEALARLNDTLKNLPQSYDMSQDSDAVKINAEIAQLESEFSSMSTGEERRNELNQKKQELVGEFDTVKDQLAVLSKNDSIKAQIKELQTNKSELEQNIANCERVEMLIEKFNDVKNHMLEACVNDHFELVKWKLFEPNVKGDGMIDVCYPTVNGIAYSGSLNKGHKLAAALDIVKSVQRIYDVNVPVIIDDCERINSYNIPKMDCQLIAMSVKSRYWLDEFGKEHEICKPDDVEWAYDGKLRIEVEE